MRISDWSSDVCSSDLWTLKEAKHDHGSVEVAVFPPFTDLRTVQTLVDADKIPFGLGAQDVSTHDSGAYPGEISGQFPATLDVRYVIIGHSERRQSHAESDEIVARTEIGRAHDCTTVNNATTVSPPLLEKKPTT